MRVGVALRVCVCVCVSHTLSERPCSGDAAKEVPVWRRLDWTVSPFPIGGPGLGLKENNSNNNNNNSGANAELLGKLEVIPLRKGGALKGRSCQSPGGLDLQRPPGVGSPVVDCLSPGCLLPYPSFFARNAVTELLPQDSGVRGEDAKMLTC